jgi:hypothetical protein
LVHMDLSSVFLVLMCSSISLATYLGIPNGPPSGCTESWRHQHTMKAVTRGGSSPPPRMPPGARREPSAGPGHVSSVVSRQGSRDRLRTPAIGWPLVVTRCQAWLPRA